MILHNEDGKSLDVYKFAVHLVTLMMNQVSGIACDDGFFC